MGLRHEHCASIPMSGRPMNRQFELVYLLKNSHNPSCNEITFSSVLTFHFYCMCLSNIFLFLGYKLKIILYELEITSLNYLFVILQPIQVICGCGRPLIIFCKFIEDTYYLSNFFLERFNLLHLLLIIAIYHQIKISIGFWCRQELNLRSLIQLLETLPIELIETQGCAKYSLNPPICLTRTRLARPVRVIKLVGLGWASQTPKIVDWIGLQIKKLPTRYNPTHPLNYTYIKKILVQIVKYLKLINSPNKFLQLINHQFPKQYRPSKNSLNKI